MLKTPLKFELHDVEETGSGIFYNVVDNEGREVEAPELKNEYNALAIQTEIYKNLWQACAKTLDNCHECSMFHECIKQEKIMEETNAKKTDS